MNRFIVLVVLSAFAVLAGCAAVGPNYRPNMDAKSAPSKESCPGGQWVAVDGNWVCQLPKVIVVPSGGYPYPTYTPYVPPMQYQFWYWRR